MRTRLAILSLLSALAFQLSGPTRALSSDRYGLSAGDRMSLKVLEWRPDRGEPFEWPGLSGDYEVGAEGFLALPLIGFVPVEQRTVAEVAGEIGDKLQKQAGLAHALQVSLQVTRYRPFYVSGNVEKPGEYPFRPDLSVLEAVSLAGGAYREPQLEAQLERQLIEARGSERGLAGERAALLSERARLKAEAQDALSLEFPSDLGDGDTAAVAAAKAVQQSLFNSRKAELIARLQGLDESKRLFNAEVSTLQDKLRVLSHQAELNKAELDNVYDLLKKGLTTATRKLELEQSQNQIESTKLEYQLSVIRAQQGVATAERDKGDALNERKTKALSDLAAVEAKLAQNEISRATSVRLSGQAQSQLKREEARQPLLAGPTLYSVRRQGVDKPILVTETDFLVPGDVLKVGDGRSPDVSN